MKEKPILFSTPMVKAILEDRKNMTRRVFKNQMKKYAGYRNQCAEVLDESREPLSEKEFYEVYSPYCKGDILWVRETWNYIPTVGHLHEPFAKYVYKAHDYIKVDWQWRPSIFMPRKAARILLVVTDVRVERLHDITEEDAIHEGVTCSTVCKDYCAPVEPLGTRKCAFHKLWNFLNGKREFGWDKNPWVWVIQFEQAKP